MRSIEPIEEKGEFIHIEDILPKLRDKAERVGAALRGARYKEDITQVELAKKLKITQGDLSKMEHGKRPIGSKLAQRIGKILKVDYRIFL